MNWFLILLYLVYHQNCFFSFHSFFFLYVIASRHDPEVKQHKEKKLMMFREKTSEKSVEFKIKRTRAVNLLRTLSLKQQMNQIEEDQFQNQ